MDIAIEFLVEKELNHLIETVKQMQGDREDGAEDAQALRCILHTVDAAIKSGALVPLSALAMEFSRQMLDFLQAAKVITTAEDETLSAEVIQ